MKNFMVELGFPLRSIDLHIDNKGARDVMSNPVHMIATNILTLNMTLFDTILKMVILSLTLSQEFVNPADIFTKSTTKDDTEELLPKLKLLREDLNKGSIVITFQSSPFLISSYLLLLFFSVHCGNFC
jgi:hypothetical protein